MRVISGPPALPARMSSTTKKLFVAGLCVALLITAWATGSLDVLGDPERVRDILREGGHASWIVYLAIFTVLAAVGVPSVVFLVPMPLVWSMPHSLALGVAGSMASSMLGFWIARYVARDWVESRLPARIRRFDEKLAENAFRTVVLIRFFFFFVPPATWFLALSRVPFTTYVLGTFVGGLPGIFFFVVVGGSFFGWLAERPPWVWATTAIAAAAWVVVRRHATRRSSVDDENRPSS
jgi:uncharacterized membrane protein YdjX (TVP38/TMEM64 family)